jgi:hypothetical protein
MSDGYDDYANPATNEISYVPLRSSSLPGLGKLYLSNKCNGFHDQRNDTGIG